MTSCRNMIDQTRTLYQKLPIENSVRDYSYQGLICRTTWSVGSYWSLYGCGTLLKRTWKLRVAMGMNGLILRLFMYLLVVAMTTSLYERSIGRDDGCIILEQPNVVDPTNCKCFETVEQIRDESAVTSNIKLIFFFLLFLSLESLLNVALTFPTEFKVKFIQSFSLWRTVKLIPFKLFYCSYFSMNSGTDGTLPQPTFFQKPWSKFPLNL